MHHVLLLLLLLLFLLLFIQTQHTFRTVFDGKTTQKQMFDEIALPLVEDVIQGKNGNCSMYM